MRVIDGAGSNPIIVIEPHEVEAWVRSIADANGYAGRELRAIQIQVAQPFGEGLTCHNETPSLAVIISSISR